MEYSNLFVCLMGIGTVFVGLICIIILVTVMSKIVLGLEKKGSREAAEETLTKAAPAPENVGVTPELIAAVSVAVAEEMGTEVSAIRIVSLKRV